MTGRGVAVLVLLAGTAVLYLWGLSASGYGNSFYAAAVQAGSQSWKAFFFGSLDAGNAITVDKPPASLWLMALSVRIFGLSSWSVLAPQALLGVATVGVIYASVRRTLSARRPSPGGRRGHRAGLVAGALLALTPAAALMFRFDNPDALLVFLMTLAALRDAAGDREGQRQDAGLGRRADRLRLPDQDAAGVPGAAGARPRLPGRRTDDRSARGCCTCSAPSRR